MAETRKKQRKNKVHARGEFAEASLMESESSADPAMEAYEHFAGHDDAEDLSTSQARDHLQGHRDYNHHGQDARQEETCSHQGNINRQTVKKNSAGVLSNLLAALGIGRFTFNRSTVHVSSVQQVIKDNDLQCTNITISQPEDPCGEYATGVNIGWNLPASKERYICEIRLEIRDNSIEVFSKTLPRVATECPIPPETLRCAEFFCATVTCTIETEGNKIPFSKNKKFYTKPSRPKDIIATVIGKRLRLKWLPCKGCDSYDVYLREIDGLDPLVHKSTKTFKCNINVDQKTIKFGKFYCCSVVAKKEHLVNQTDEEIFVGEDSSPREVLAKKTGENIVMVSWTAPRIPTEKYLVEVVPKDGRTRKIEVNNAVEARIKDLKNGTTYTFFVAASFEDGWSQKSVSNSIKTESCTIVVKKLRVQQNNEESSSALNCSWDPTAGAVGYKIQCRTAEKSVTIYLGPVTERHIIRELQPNTEYHVSVAAREPNGYGPYCDRRSKKTGPGKVSSVAIVQAGHQLAVNFRPAIGATKHCVLLQESSGTEAEKITKDLDKSVEVIFYKILPDARYEAFISAMYDEAKGPSVSASLVTVPAAPKWLDIKISPHPEKPWAAFKTSVQRSVSYEYEMMVTCSKDISDVSTISMVSPNDREAVHMHKCFNKGVPYRVKVRARNQGGFGEWSSERVVKPAPWKIESLNAWFEDGKISVKWKKVPYADDYSLELYETGKDKAMVEVSLTPEYHFQKFHPQHGAKYYCVVAPRNKAGNGLKSYSNNVFIPLDPPRELSVNDHTSHLLFRWKPSYGMRVAQITFWSSDMRTEENTNKTSWKSPPVRHGQVYEIRITARNGKYISEERASLTHVTAPTAVLSRRHEIRPESCLDVEIVTCYDGPFRVCVLYSNGPRFVTRHVRNVTIDSLEPATEYSFSAACLYEDETKQSPACCSKPVLTMPSKVTNVECSQLLPNCRQLSWDSCGNSQVKYTIFWSRNNAFLPPLTTYDTEYKLPHFEYGSYTFAVSAGGGKKSDVCRILVPSRPIITMQVLSSNIVKIRCQEAEFVSYYVLKIFLEKDEICTMEKKDGRFWLEQEFIAGKQYLAQVRTSSGEFLSDATMRYFITNLEPPGNLKYCLDKHSPTTTAHFEWTLTENMFMSRIEICNFQGETIVHADTLDCKWSYDGLCPNQQYVFKIFPGTQENFFGCGAERPFITAPSSPERVEVKKNPHDATTKMDITIVSDYEGPFVVTIADSGAVSQSWIVRASVKTMTVENLNPGTQYKFYVQAEFTEEANNVTHLSSKTWGTSF